MAFKTPIVTRELKGLFVKDYLPEVKNISKKKYNPKKWGNAELSSLDDFSKLKKAISSKTNFAYRVCKFQVQKIFAMSLFSS